MAELDEEVAGQPEMPVVMHQAFGSTNVDSFGYDDKRQVLIVKFVGRAPKWYGAVYEYPADKALYLRMLASPSKGKFVREHLDRIPHVRVQ